MRLARVFLLVTVSLFVPSLATANYYETGEFRVKLNVSGEDEIKREIISYVSRELRSLRDVVITDVNPDYELALHGVYLTSNGGQKLGALLNISMYYIPKFKYFEHMIKDEHKEEFKMQLYPLRGEVFGYMRYGSDGGVKKFCQDIVMMIDSEVFLDKRKTKQEWDDVSLKAE